MSFAFDRLGVRVPAILISPWIPKGTIVNRVFDHASIPGTLTKFFLGDYSPRSPRETSADVFIEPNVVPVNPARNLLSLDIMRTDCPDFDVQE
jgi:phospholipase C